MKDAKVKNISKKEKSRDYRNESAAFLSIIPGGGHMFKGHLFWGFLLLIISPLFVWMALHFGEVSGGFSWFIPIFYIFFAGWSAYCVRDLHAHKSKQSDS